MAVGLCPHPDEKLFAREHITPIVIDVFRSNLAMLRNPHFRMVNLKCFARAFERVADVGECESESSEVQKISLEWRFALCAVSRIGLAALAKAYERELAV